MAHTSSRLAETQRNQAGLTLIEIMLVVAIVAILAAVGWPLYLDQVARAGRSEARAALMECAGTQERRLTEANSYVANTCRTQSEHARFNITVETPDSCKRTIGNIAFYSCFIAKATATSGRSQARDGRCSTFTINELGQKRSFDIAGNPSQNCW